jgi:hypothetical protein
MKNTNVQLVNFQKNAKKRLRRILGSHRLQQIIDTVAQAYKADKAIIEADFDLSAHGAFDPDSGIPRILLNPKTGLTESNLAHELIHALQIKEGFPTVPKIYKDKRSNVLRELGANILHIPLIGMMRQRGFSVKEYLTPTLSSITKNLSERDKKAETTMIFVRSHYEACIYIRLQFEATFLSKNERHRFESLFGTKAPIATSIGNQLIKLIKSHDVYKPKGSILALYQCVEFLNKKDLSKEYSDYFLDPYSDFLGYWQKKYPFVKSKG